MEQRPGKIGFPASHNATPRDYRLATTEERAMARGFIALWDSAGVQDADDWLYVLRNRAELLVSLDEDDSREAQDNTPSLGPFVEAASPPLDTGEAPTGKAEAFYQNQVMPMVEQVAKQLTDTPDERLKPERWWEVYDWCRDIQKLAQQISERVDSFANAIPDPPKADTGEATPAPPEIEVAIRVLNDHDMVEEADALRRKASGAEKEHK